MNPFYLYSYSDYNAALPAFRHSRMNDSELSQVFKALSNPNRLRLYREIMQRQEHGLAAEQGCALAELLPLLKIGAPTLSHHMKELVNANLVQVVQKGRYKTCYLNEFTRKAVATFFAGLQ